MITLLFIISYLFCFLLHVGLLLNLVTLFLLLISVTLLYTTQLYCNILAAEPKILAELLNIAQLAEYPVALRGIRLDLYNSTVLHVNECKNVESSALLTFSD